MPAPRPLHIAMLSIHSSPTGPLGSENTGGMSVYVSELARWLGRGGHCIDIFTYVPGTPQIIDLHPNVRLIHLTGQDRAAPVKEELPAHLEDAFDLLEKQRIRSNSAYDLIHSHYWLSAEVGAMARRQWHVPHLVTFHTLGAVKNDKTTDRIEPSGRLARERELVGAADGIIVPVAGEQAHLTAHYDADPQKVSVIPCGVNLERFQPKDRAAARLALGIDLGKEMVIYVGRFAPLKGVGTLLDAVAQIHKVRPRLELVLVGGDEPAAKRDRALMDRAKNLGIEDRVVFAGRCSPEQLVDYYTAADVMALPSHYESFGLVILEALACGTPVLATPVGIAPAVIVDGLNGILVAEPSPQAVAQGLVRLLDRAGRQRPSPDRVRATVAGYGWNRTAEAMARCYQEAVAAFAI